MRRAFGIFTATLTEDLCREIAFDFISKISVEVASSQQPNHARLVLLSHFFDGRIPGITSNSSSSALNLNKRNNAEVIKGMELRDFEVNDPSMTPCRFSQRSKAADGAYHIAIMCLDGLGTQRNAKRALEFLDLSVRLGSPQAKMDYPAILAATQPLGTSTSSAYDVAGNARLTSPGYIGQILGSGTVFNDSDQAELLTRHAKSLQPHLVGTSLQLLRTHAAESIEPAACKALISMTIMSRPRMILEGGAEWESKFTSILDMLVTKSVIEHFPKLTGKADNIDLLTFAAQRNDVALKWLINKYTNAELRLHFPRTFSETLPLAVSTNMNFGRSERVQMLLQLSPGNSLLSTSGLLPDLVHHRPSQVPIYGKHLKESGAGAALNEMNYFSETAFDVALQYGYIDVMKYLLEEGASYNECRLTPDFRIDQSLCSPLAMVLGSKIQVDFLMSLNPPPSLIVTASGMNVFHVLAGREPAAESESELDEQLDTFYAMEPGLIDASGGRDKLTPFHLVALHYATTVGAFLYSNGANINALDRMGRTPLDLLLLHGSPDQDYNFDPGMEDSQSKFICDYALAGPIYWHKEQTLQAAMIEKFVKWGAKRSSARPMGNETSVKSLKQDGFLQRVAAYPALEESESNGVGFVAGAFATTKPRNEIFVHPTVTSGVPKKRGTRFLDLFRKRNPRD
ncbi:hypothetical protein QQS21_003946 [Conoideocrella luteorostrata]|uniref:Ankyrin n=1 Tax=Conoideocrella luteorostrata TaxID=1105319 RepID=A0AAJ0G085_9HYPO|nr:hypothetical protein QQS21_003946 [Conoideocrella luteorostrata]